LGVTIKVKDTDKAATTNSSGVRTIGCNMGELSKELKFILDIGRIKKLCSGNRYFGESMKIY
jgi:hypothetical protein